MGYADQIKTRTKILLRMAWHHGIDLGDGTVIHFRGQQGQKDKKQAQIIRTTLEEFLGGQPFKVVHHKECLEPDEVIRRAIWRLGDQGYGLIFNNCEHFANWCKTGKRISKQTKGLDALSRRDPGDSILDYDIYLGEGRD